MKLTLDNKKIENQILALSKHLQSNGLESLYIPSFDHNISEYVPLFNNLRYLFTGFTGSMGDALLVKDKLFLFVDGRYHIQADQEVRSSLIEIVKLQSDISILDALILKLNDLGLQKISLIPERTPFSYQEKFANFQTELISEDKVLELIDYKVENTFGAVTEVKSELIGQTVRERLTRVGLNENEAQFLSAIDDISWLTNLRGYHLPFLSSIVAKALVTKDQIFLFADQSIKFPTLAPEIKLVTTSLKETASSLKLNKVFFDKNFSTLSDFLALENLKVNLVPNDGLTYIKSIKFDVELPAFERSFEKGDQAIFNTIKLCQSSVEQNISEKDLYNKTSEMYRAQGAITQSFNTISGVGANGAIVHYGDPKSDVFIKENDLVLLDSGGYFEEGIATDTTRTFIASVKKEVNSPKLAAYRKAYTLVLKAQMQVEMAVFKEGTLGNALDMLARQVLFRHGLDFMHGLGHGVGVHVHEPGVRLSPVSRVPMKLGQVVSIEPGLYFPGEFGIRHENICIVEKHGAFLKFRPLVFIGVDERLVDPELLDSDEKNYLAWYQNECEKRSRKF
jgi:Xaa-Pro aminopeptidase